MHAQLLIADFPNSGGSFPSNGQLITIKLELIQSPLLGNDKRCRMIAGLEFDHKGFPTVLNSVSPGPLSRKSIAFLFPLLEGTVTRLDERMYNHIQFNFLFGSVTELPDARYSQSEHNGWYYLV